MNKYRADMVVIWLMVFYIIGYIWGKYGDIIQSRIVNNLGIGI